MKANKCINNLKLTIQQPFADSVDHDQTAQNPKRSYFLSPPPKKKKNEIVATLRILLFVRKTHLIYLGGVQFRVIPCISKTRRIAWKNKSPITMS